MLFLKEVNFKKAINLDPNFAAPYLFLGLDLAERWVNSWKIKGHDHSLLKKSIYYYRKVIELEPENQEARSFLKTLEEYENKKSKI